MKKIVGLKERWSHFLRQEARPLIILILVICAFRSAIADWNDVPTGSMKPTIMEGDRILVNKLAYDLKIPFTTQHLAQWDNPHHGEIVVFFSPADNQRLVKRVIGLPGDRIELRNEEVFVNGLALKYEPLSQKVVDQLPAAEQPQHQFASEDLAAHPHAVMTTPALSAMRNFGPITVPKGQYFMMGDNRDNSYDSRYYGCVDRDRIVGRALAVVISMDRNDHYVPRWSRFFSSLQ